MKFDHDLSAASFGLLNSALSSSGPSTPNSYHRVLRYITANMSTAQSPSLLQFKAATALDLITKSPQLWFPENGPDERDEALLSAVPVSFVNYSQGSYLRKMVRYQDGWFVTPY